MIGPSDSPVDACPALRTIAGAPPAVADAEPPHTRSRYTAAGILAETPVGGIVGFLLGTGALGYGIWLASEAYKAIQDTWEVVDVLVMVTSALSTVGMGSGATLGLPAGYDNRIVP